MTTVTLDIPDAVLKGIENGDLIRWGGIIRDTAGQIVLHLVDAPASGAAAGNAARSAQVGPGFLGKIVERSTVALKTGPSKETLIVAGTVVLAASMAAGAVVAVKKFQGSRVPLPENLAAYNTSLGAYLQAVNDGGLEAETVRKLIIDLDEVFEGEDAAGKRVKLDFTTKKGKVLAGLIADFTAKLSAAHGLDATLLLEFEKTYAHSTGSESVDAVRRHLAIQERILRDKE